MKPLHHKTILAAVLVASIGAGIFFFQTLLRGAVQVGAVINPTFGPTDENVGFDVLDSPIQKITRDITGTGLIFNEAVCPAGHVALGGGCEFTNGDAARCMYNAPIIAGNQSPAGSSNVDNPVDPSPGWACRCFDPAGGTETLRTHVLCGKENPLL